MDTAAKIDWQPIKVCMTNTFLVQDRGSNDGDGIFIRVQNESNIYYHVRKMSAVDRFHGHKSYITPIISLYQYSPHRQPAFKLCMKECAVKLNYALVLIFMLVNIDSEGSLRCWSSPL